MTNVTIRVLFSNSGTVNIDGGSLYLTNVCPGLTKALEPVDVTVQTHTNLSSHKMLTPIRILVSI